MDFMSIFLSQSRAGTVVDVDFLVKPSKHLLTRGGEFYALWDKECGLWTKDEMRAVQLIDKYIWQEANAIFEKEGERFRVRTMQSGKTGLFKEWLQYTSIYPSSLIPILDQKPTFLGEETTPEMLRSKRLPYSPCHAPAPSYDRLMTVLYDPPTRRMLEWALGAVLTGGIIDIQKFIVLYGPPGSGKSTWLNIVQMLLEGYTTTFDAASLVNNSNFPLAPFKDMPIVAIQHDGDLSRVEDNSLFNMVVSHEPVNINEKYMVPFKAVINALLLLGTNKPIQITDLESGFIRRLLVAEPSGRRLKKDEYKELMSRVPFELGAIVHICEEVYNSLGPNAFDDDRPVDMLHRTDLIANYVNAAYHILSQPTGVTLKQAYRAYAEYCGESNITRLMPQFRFREAIKPYFKQYHKKLYRDGQYVYGLFQDLNVEKLREVLDDYEEIVVETAPVTAIDEGFRSWIELREQPSLLDEVYKDYQAQYANCYGIPEGAWQLCTTTTKDIDTSRLHYVNVSNPKHIVIDFDLRDENGEKNLQLNIEAASQFPPTYAEISKSGAGLHLSYYFEGDVERLAAEVRPGVEIKKFLGNAPDRRMHTLCNDLPIATLTANLPYKEAKKTNRQQIKDEAHLRNAIAMALRKEVHSYTKPSVLYIKHVLEESSSVGVSYDVSDLKARVLSFAMNSSNNAKDLVGIALSLPYTNGQTADDICEEKVEANAYVVSALVYEQSRDIRLTMYDVEVFPNLFMLGYIDLPPLSQLFKMTREEIYALAPQVVNICNPVASVVEDFMMSGRKLGGHNVKSYDNHVVYAASLGETNQQLFERSQAIVSNTLSRQAKGQYQFRNAWDLSYFDTLDLCKTVKDGRKGLKHLQIKLGIKHDESEFPWDENLDEVNWPRVMEYNTNDILSNVIVLVEYLRGSWFAKHFLSYYMSKRLGQAPSVSPWMADRLIYENCLFGSKKSNPNPSKEFPCVDLRDWFPEYELDSRGVAWYNSDILGRINLGKGGLVLTEPGFYHNANEYDLDAGHPHAIKTMNVFGPYTKTANAFLEANLALKRKDADRAFEVLGMTHEDLQNVNEFAFGVRADELSDADIKAVRWAVKIFCNQGYGCFTATFDTRSRNPHNNGNPVANYTACTVVRGVEAAIRAGGKMIHVKTDSIKVPDCAPEVERAIIEAGEKVGQHFAYEDTYRNFLLVNKASFVAYSNKTNSWYVKTKTFLRPYILKSLFTGEPMSFADYCETVASEGTLYLVNPDDENDRAFVGKVGSFLPVKSAAVGGRLLFAERSVKKGDDTEIEGDIVSPENSEECDGEEPAFAMAHAANTSGYLWMEAPLYKELYGENLSNIDDNYYQDARAKVCAMVDKYCPGGLDELLDIEANEPFEMACREARLCGDCEGCSRLIPGPENDGDGRCLWGYRPTVLPF